MKQQKYLSVTATTGDGGCVSSEAFEARRVLQQLLDIIGGILEDT